MESLQKSHQVLAPDTMFLCLVAFNKGTQNIGRLWKKCPQLQLVIYSNDLDKGEWKIIPLCRNALLHQKYIYEIYYAFFYRQVKEYKYIIANRISLGTLQLLL